MKRRTKEILAAKSIEDLLELPDFRLEIRTHKNQMISNAAEFLGTIPLVFSELGQAYVIAVHAPIGIVIYIHLRQQPATCSNAIAYDLCYDKDEDQSKDSFAYALKVAIFASIAAGYTNLSLTDLSESPTVEIAQNLGFETLDNYTNKRTGNRLSDLRIRL